MRTVEMSLQTAELGAAMAKMRMWLDEHRFEPSVFSCRDNGADVVVRVDFKIAAEAEAFAGSFSGQIGGHSTGSEQQEPRRVPSPLLPAQRLVG
jgi:hypothetical protein